MIKIHDAMLRLILVAVVQLLALGVTAIGSLAITGYLLSIKVLYDWNMTSGMSAATATALIGVGFSLFILGLLAQGWHTPMDLTKEQ